ncbi:hypothetical protein GCM10009552_16150 [Rothia nasimurium]|uniref:Uncharacterized protein n=1 Tax=Luteibacter anthropi TaxID=564369 RepID=A0A7X5UB66_9GAMM|nr:hypothetical protein [Luteibacter anthropi]NII07274.1 hypothetical protein [Luteibacter anthropi]
MDIDGVVIFNFLPNGTIVPDGDHQPAVGDTLGVPFTAIGVRLERIDVGVYRITAPGARWLDGWKVEIFKNENSENTVRVALVQEDGAVVIKCVDPESREPKDVVYMMTVRIGVSGAIDYLPPALPDVGSFAPSIGLPDSLSQQADTPAVEN